MGKKIPKNRIPYNPVYGYCTAEQYAKLQMLGLGPERDCVLKQIEYQNKKKGNVD